MQTRQKSSERGFTLPELIISMAMTVVLLGVVVSLMGITERQWTTGDERRDMTTELALATEKMSVDLRSSAYDSVQVSQAGDTLKIGGSIRYYRSSADSSLIRVGPGNLPAFLDGMSTQFKVFKPYVAAPGDTLKNAVAAKFVVANSSATDSTYLVVVPRMK